MDTEFRLFRTLDEHWIRAQHLSRWGIEPVRRIVVIHRHNDCLRRFSVAITKSWEESEFRTGWQARVPLVNSRQVLLWGGNG